MARTHAGKSCPSKPWAPSVRPEKPPSWLTTSMISEESQPHIVAHKANGSDWPTWMPRVLLQQESGSGWIDVTTLHVMKTTIQDPFQTPELEPMQREDRRIRPQVHCLFPQKTISNDFPLFQVSKHLFFPLFEVSKHFPRILQKAVDSNPERANQFLQSTLHSSSHTKSRRKKFWPVKNSFAPTKQKKVLNYHFPRKMSEEPRKLNDAETWKKLLSSHFWYTAPEAKALKQQEQRKKQNPQKQKKIKKK